jgi:hypothetical protein
MVVGVGTGCNVGESLVTRLAVTNDLKKVVNSCLQVVKNNLQ